MVDDQTLPMENDARASLLQLLCAPKHCHEGQCLMSTILFACSELPFVDFEEIAMIAVSLSMSPTKRTPSRSQNTVAIHFLMEKVFLNGGMRMDRLFGLIS